MALANMTQKETDRENREHCKSIAETLDKIVLGELYLCRECGEYTTIEIDEHITQPDVYRMDCCGHETEWEPEQVSLYDWLEGALDIEYRVGSDKEYRSARFMVAFGGPTIYIDTASGMVELYWWTDRASYPLRGEVVAELDEIAAELWGCM